VVRGGLPRAAQLLLAVLLVAATAAASAQNVTARASIDRAAVRENESFTFTIRAEGQVRGEPDLGPLERDFDIVQRTSSTRVQIVNGDTSRVTEWFLQLMPRQTGRLILPPLEIDGAFTSPIELEVLPALAADAPADIFMEVEVDPPDPYVQGQAIYRLKIYLGVNTGRATITPPEISRGEAIIEPLDQEQYQTVIDGRPFVVHERRFAVFPQRPGELEIGPAFFEAMVLPERGFSRMQRLRSEHLGLDVRPAVAPPSLWSSAAWLPARRVTISERWSDEEEGMVVGVPQTRTIVVEAEGLQETQLPALSVPQHQSVRQYPDQPELSREAGPDGLSARRVERFAVMGMSPGAATLPAVELPWWNVVDERWEVARLPERTFDVLQGAQAPALPLLPLEPSEPAVARGVGFWPAATAGLLLAWLTTLALWWQDRRQAARRPKVERPFARRPANRRLLRQLRGACAANDDSAARRLLLEWGAVRFPEAPPRSLGALAERLPGDLARQVAVLEEHAYGGRKEPWDGRSMRAALADVDSVARTASRKGADPLLPLYR
jgi:hypothetical protein